MAAGRYDTFDYLTVIEKVVSFVLPFTEFPNFRKYTARRGSGPARPARRGSSESDVRGDDAPLGVDRTAGAAARRGGGGAGRVKLKAKRATVNANAGNGT